MTAIFHDPTRTRQRLTRAIAVVFVLVAGAVLSLFVITLVDAPRLPALLQRTSPGHAFRLPRARAQRAAALGAKKRLLDEIARERRLAAAPPPSGIAAAFYAPWQETGLHSLEANAGRLTHLMPAWLRLSPDGASLDFTDWNPSVVWHNLEVIKLAQAHNVRVLPVLSNAVSGEFQQERAHQLLTNPAARQRVIAQLREWLLANKFSGVNVDFENLTPDDAKLLPQFMNELSAGLRPSGLQITADLQASIAPEIWSQVAGVCDFVVVMGYDQHGSASKPGPIASLGWYRGVLDNALKSVPREKLVMGIGNYGYDWTEGEGAEPLSYQQALMRARDVFGAGDAPKSIEFDPADLNPTFNYEDDEGTAHEVWMLDAVTAANDYRLAVNSGVRGVAVWALGLEDPSVWQYIDRNALGTQPLASRLETMRYPYAVEFLGDGEILQVAAQPNDGSRNLEVDSATGLIVDEAYQSFPTPFVIRRTGYKPKVIALTIDDGPAEPYTSQILDVLKQYHVHATFFLIGENLERYPDLVDRIYAEGHEIGSHTYTHVNMGEVSDLRATLELNATQRAIESTTGHSTVLFRPPYNADAEPTTKEEVLPVIRAAELGYITVGEFIDPLDWEDTVRLPDGRVIHKTGNDVAQAVLANVDRERGNCVLLHDGGGNRAATVDALKILLPALQKRGYRFATVSDLMGTSRDTLMPKVSASERFLLGDDRVVFGATSRTDRFLALAFVAAIILGIARVLTLFALALRGRAKEQSRVFDALYRPQISVVIAAYNEERVIAKTIGSILRSTYAPFEIIVIDDGSTDATSDVVRAIAEEHPTVKLIRQSNGGKASALNHAIRFAAGEILVCIDADTVLDARAIEMLVRHFADANVGAVAGNVKVGNRSRLATIFQSIEYTTSQNLDRRAWEWLNAVPVVPGAIGAWRRDAVVAAGGYSEDTMAEDTDLTWRLRRAGWRIACDNNAISRTEAPETIRQLFRQRFRWAFGTLQCLWKHRDALGRYGWFGRAMMPALWVFQILFQLLSPVVDLQLGWTMLQIGTGLLAHGTVAKDTIASLILFGGMFVVFSIVDMLAAVVAHRIEREPMRQLPLLVLQRFFYRQLMYMAILKSITSAVQGIRTGWNKLERLGTVTPG